MLVMPIVPLERSAPSMASLRPRARTWWENLTLTLTVEEEGMGGREVVVVVEVIVVLWIGVLRTPGWWIEKEGGGGRGSRRSTW